MVTWCYNSVTESSTELDIGADIGQKLRIRAGSCHAGDGTSSRCLISQPCGWPGKEKAVGEQMRPKRPLNASGGTAEMSSALPDSRLLGYRMAVDDLVK